MDNCLDKEVQELRSKENAQKVEIKLLEDKIMYQEAQL